MSNYLERKRLTKDRPIMIKEAAYLIGCSRQALAHIEQQRHYSVRDPKIIDKISEVYGVDKTIVELYVGYVPDQLRDAFNFYEQSAEAFARKINKIFGPSS